MNFEDLPIIEPILRAIKEEGYTQPTPIQEQAIPILLAGRDLLGCAQTGTGKTAAFAIPILQLLQEQASKPGRKTIGALILTPTRELAIQIGESFASYGKYTKVRHTVIFGGVSQMTQVNAIRQGVDVLIATPGRLMDLMDQGIISLKDLKIFTLDEADRMLDMGFVRDVRKILTKIPKERQSLFFSATMPTDIAQLADTILRNPETVKVTPVSSTVDVIDQSLYHVSKANKTSLLIHLLDDEAIATVLVFTRTKHGADKIVRSLCKENIKSAAIHGNKSQNARQKALSDFKSRHLRVLVATDIAARGIDIDELSHVINYDIPNIPETYVHRIGRTGRAGLSGVAMSFCQEDETTYLKDILKLIKRNIRVIDEHPFPLEYTSQQSSYSDKPAIKAPAHKRPAAARLERPRLIKRN